MGIEKLRAELAHLQATYEKKIAHFSRSAFVPPAIKSDVLSQITNMMDKIDVELEIIESNCDGCELSPAGPYCADCRWYT